MDHLTQQWVTDQAPWSAKESTCKPRSEPPRIATPSFELPKCAEDRCCSATEAHAPNVEICTDPACSEFDCDECFDYEKYCQDCTGGQQAVCEECSEHDAVCQDCFDDCTSDCDLQAADCTETCGAQYDRTASGPCTDYCGNQSVDAFGFYADSSAIPSGLHPHWATSYFDHHMASACPPPEQSLQDYSAYSRGGAPFPVHCARQPNGLELLQAAGSACLDQAHAQNTSNKSFFENDYPLKVSKTFLDTNGQLPGRLPTRIPWQGSPDIILKPSLPSILADTQSSDLPAQKSTPTKSRARDLICQWADDAGQPCGKLFHQADDLHDHLREVHNTKSDVFCRWAGCPLNTFTANPHRYANSVQRHTWGHSGYRPYKCSACGEGFAAANVRDEHFSNIHLKEKQFRCDVCSHQCTSATNLKRHKDERHRAERFQCEFCNRNGKIKLFPRGPNLARHFRKCKYVLAIFPEAKGAAEGKIDESWYPPGYKKGHHGMNRAKITPPVFLHC